MATLAHYGVKGMKWGVHRSEDGSSEKKPASEDFEKANKARTIAKTSGTKALSNKELQDIVTRMNLEQQYSRLNPTASAQATKFVADILLSAGKQQAARAANDFAGKAIGAAIKAAADKKARGNRLAITAS